MSPSYVELNHTWMDVCQCVTDWIFPGAAGRPSLKMQRANELTSYEIRRMIFCAPLKILQMATILITIMSKCGLL